MSQSTYVHAFGNTRFEQERDAFMNPVTILTNKLKTKIQIALLYPTIKTKTIIGLDKQITPVSLYKLQIIELPGR